MVSFIICQLQPTPKCSTDVKYTDHDSWYVLSFHFFIGS